MDVTNVTSLPRGNMKDRYNLHEDHIDRGHRADILRKSLSQIKQDLTNKKEKISANSFEAAAKMALAESYINSGKFFAAEQVIKEISETTHEEIKPKHQDDVYIRDQVDKNEQVEKEKNIKAEGVFEEGIMNPLDLINLEEDKADNNEPLRLLTEEINNQVGETLSVLRTVITGFYGIEENQNK